MGFGPDYKRPETGELPEFFTYGTSLRDESNRASILQDMVVQVLQNQGLLQVGQEVDWKGVDPWAQGVAGILPEGTPIVAIFVHQRVIFSGSSGAWHLVGVEPTPQYDVIEYEVQLIIRR